MRSVSSPMALSMMMAGPSGPAMRRQMASPSSPGSMMSSTTRSTGPFDRIRSISLASPAVSTTKPWRVRKSDTTSRMPGSSSTIRMRTAGPLSVRVAVFSARVCMPPYRKMSQHPDFRTETALFAGFGQGLVGNPGIGAPFRAKGGHRSVSRHEGDIVAQRPELGGDGGDQLAIVAARKVGPPDRVLEQHVADLGEARLAMEEDHVAGR